MKQSSNKKSREATAFLYERLSRDDNLEGESYSIGKPKKKETAHQSCKGKKAIPIWFTFWMMAFPA